MWANLEYKLKKERRFLGNKSQRKVTIPIQNIHGLNKSCQ